MIDQVGGRRVLIGANDEDWSSTEVWHGCGNITAFVRDRRPPALDEGRLLVLSLHRVPMRFDRRHGMVTASASAVSIMVVDSCRIREGQT